MEYTIEFGAALIAILMVAMVCWGIYWKNEIKATVAQRERLNSCNQLEPTRFTTTRKTDVIQIESLKHPPVAVAAHKQRKTISGQQ